MVMILEKGDPESREISEEVMRPKSLGGNGRERWEPMRRQSVVSKCPPWGQKSRHPHGRIQVAVKHFRSNHRHECEALPGLSLAVLFGTPLTWEG